MWQRLITLSFFVVVLAPGAGAYADELSDRRASSLYDSLMSPYCPAVTLSACTSPNARSLRDEIRRWISEGKSDPEIKALLIEQFGQGVLGVPAGNSFSIIGWLMPFFAVFLGGAVLVQVLRRLTREAEPVAGEESGEQATVTKFEKEVDEEIFKRMV